VNETTRACSYELHTKIATAIPTARPAQDAADSGATTASISSTMIMGLFSLLD
jgi:hypothetical protein